MNARDRGALILRLAELMDEHKEELATIESIGKYLTFLNYLIKNHRYINLLNVLMIMSSFFKILYCQICSSTAKFEKN